MFDKHLLEKYNVPVPRYTSYPPANHFSEEINANKYLELVSESNKWKPEHISFYVHIPFCKKICYYCGCNAIALNRPGEVVSYIKALKKEILLLAEKLDDRREIKQIHFGGGTPNAIPVNFLMEIIELFHGIFSFSNDAEIAIETNPAYLTREYIQALNRGGFNRYSLGIQDFNQEVLNKVNRLPSGLPLNILMEEIRNNPDAAVNLDFIYGLPGQTTENFRDTVRQAIELEPERLVTFSYAHVPWIKKHQQVLEKFGLPGPEEKIRLFQVAYEEFTAANYAPIGLDHFVKKDDELYLALQNNKLHRNFQGYCSREKTGQVYAFGISAISQLEKAYIQNTKNLKAYNSFLEKGMLPVEKALSLSKDQMVAREVITHFMCNKELDWDVLADRLNITVRDLHQTIGYTEEKMNVFVTDELLELNRMHLKVTDKGALFIRNIAAALDPEYSEKTNKYSKAV